MKLTPEDIDKFETYDLDGNAVTRAFNRIKARVKNSVGLFAWKVNDNIRDKKDVIEQKKKELLGKQKKHG
jgi:urease gamma subunit